jgi:SagB-type dehydrogenase family enzyme
MAELTISVRFEAGLTARVGCDRELSLVRGPKEISLRVFDDGACARIVTRMASVGASLAEVVELSGELADPSALAAWRLVLKALCGAGVLRLVVQQDGEEFLTVIPTSVGFEWPILSVASPRLVFSRFAHLRREGGTLLLESPRAHCRVTIAGEQAARLLLAFARSRETAEISLVGLPGEVVGLLEALGFLVECDEHGESADDRGSLAPWEFHDLIFHTRSRRGRHARPIGGTYRFLGRTQPPPVVRDRYPGPSVALDRPDMNLLSRADATLTRAMEDRRSERSSAHEPVSANQLGELLFRCVAVRRLEQGEHDEISRRPYPSGGARYPLEVYLGVGACRGLATGFYHYDALGHSLTLVAERSPALAQLMREASVGPEPPQVLVVIAARFERASWKYEGIAYSLILKEAGAVTQSFYLVGAAMGLGICAVGHGDSDRFSELAGRDPYVESSVAELVVGSGRRNEDPPDHPLTRR